MKLDTIALIGAIIAAGIWVIGVLIGLIGFAQQSVLAFIPALFFAGFAYIFISLIVRRLREDDPFDKIER